MATRDERTVSGVASGRRRWVAGAVSGLLAGVAMGLPMHYAMELMPTVGALYGQPTVAAGWVVHLFNAVAFGLAFVAVVTRTPLRTVATSATNLVGLGAAYGFVLWVVAASFVMPAWVNAVGAGSPPVPSLEAAGILTHLLFGLVLGGLVAVDGRRAESTRKEPTAESAGGERDLGAD
jgi:cytochrome bd-type quinol oxidase subunit 2